MTFANTVKPPEYGHYETDVDAPPDIERVVSAVFDVMHDSSVPESTRSKVRTNTHEQGAGDVLRRLITHLNGRV